MSAPPSITSVFITMLLAGVVHLLRWRKQGDHK